MLKYALLVLLVVIGLMFAVKTEDELTSGDAEKGRLFAEKNCGKCHAIGPEGDSPLELAPTFRSFGQRWPVEYLAESLAEGIVTGHADMPEFVLSPDEIDDFLSYLNALQPK